MIYKTIITDASIRRISDAHKIVHRVMHDPDEHKPCPPFLIAGDSMILVQSSYKPRSKGATVAEVNLDDTNTVKLRVRVAAVRRDPETKREKPILANGKIDTGYIKDWVIRRFGEFGLTPVDDNSVRVRYGGRIGDETHNMRNCPIADIEGVWKVGKKSMLEKLLVTKLGRRNFLGLGMVRLVNN
jgi:hypothetical protein